MKSAFAILAAVPLLSGCVAAAIPVVAAGAMAGKRIAKKENTEVVAPAPEVAAVPVVVAAPPAPVAEPAAVAIAPPPSVAEMSMGEGLPPFVAYALAKVKAREEGGAVASVALVDKVDIDAARFLPCDGLPLAVMLDLDAATAPEGDAAKLGGTSGLAEGLAALRKREVHVLWVAADPRDREAALRSKLIASGLDPAGADELVLVRGPGDRKQLARLDAARGHCVIAIAGDQRADIDELFDYLRSPDRAFALDKMWGAGWFLMPPPLNLDLVQ